jgi:hypothetical protein
MFRRRYHFDPQTLRYVQVKRTLKSKLLLTFVFSSVTILLTVILINITNQAGTRLKYLHLKSVNSRLVEDYQQLDKKMDYYDGLLGEYQLIDDSIYRCILDVEPLPSYLREPASGGHDPYNYLEGYSSSDIMITTSLHFDNLKLRTDLQEHSFTDLDRLADEKKSLLSCKPSIQPISMDNYFWLSSDFGWRIDPFSKRSTFHNGLDFASEPGLNVYATGDGTVSFVKLSNGGYGNVLVIDHGYGYSSKYGHLQKIFVHSGQKVYRGQIIALLGNSGKSTGPHLHYGVEYLGKSVNPYFYFSDDLSPREYNKVVSLSERVDN